jgi:hypothetical protein
MMLAMYQLQGKHHAPASIKAVANVARESNLDLAAGQGAMLLYKHINKLHRPIR